MLIVEFYTLGGIDVLNGLNEGVHSGLNVSESTEHTEVDEAAGNLVTSTDNNAILNARHEADRCRYTPLLDDTGSIVCINNTQQVLGGLWGNVKNTRDWSQVSLAAKNLLVDVANDVEHTSNGRKTLRNIVCACNTTGVNGTHGQLSTRLTNGLSCDNTNCSTNVDRTTGGKIPAVALLADAVLRLTGQKRTELNLSKAVLNKTLKILLGLNIATSRDKNLASVWIADILKGAAANQVSINRSLTRLNQRIGNCLISAAVLLADNDVLRNVDESTSQVTRVGGVGCGIYQALTSAVGRNEVLKRLKTLAEVCLNWKVDGFTGHIRHQASHTSKLAKLCLRTTSSRVSHHVNWVVLCKACKHLRAEKIGALGPCINNLNVTLSLGKEAVLVVLVDLVNAVLCLLKQLWLVWRNDSVPNRNGQTSKSCVVETSLLDVVQNWLNISHWVTVAAIVDQNTNVGLNHLVVDVWVILWQALTVEDNATNSGLKTLGALSNVQVLILTTASHNAEDSTIAISNVCILGAYADNNLCLKIKVTVSLNSQKSILKACKGKSLSVFTGLLGSEVVDTKDHILRRNGQNLTRSRASEVVAGEHQNASLCLCLSRKWHVNRHLVAVEVCVEWCADQRVQVDCLTLDKDWLKCLDRQTVKGRCAVEKNEAVLNDLIQNVPNNWSTTVNSALCALNVFNLAKLNQTTHDKWLEELKCHSGWKTALVQFQVWVNNNDGTARVVNTLTQKVLTEATLLTLKGLSKRLQRTSTTTSDGTTTATVVKQSVNGLLKHALLVVNNDGRCVKVKQALKTIVTVNNTTIQIV